MDQHFTEVFEYETIHPLHGYRFKQWGWRCFCNKTQSGYPNRHRALLGAQLHRAETQLPA